MKAKRLRSQDPRLIVEHFRLSSSHPGGVSDASRPFRVPGLRNRRFVRDGDRLFTQPVDLSKVADPSLIIYDAMLALPGIQLVSNGDQTSTVYNALQVGGTAEAVLDTYWDALDENNRVSLAVKEVEPDGSTGECLIRNRHA